MNYPTAREEFDRLMRELYPQGRPRSRSPIKVPVDPKWIEAINEGRAERARIAQEMAQAEEETEAANG